MFINLHKFGRLDFPTKVISPPSPFEDWRRKLPVKDDQNVFLVWLISQVNAKKDVDLLPSSDQRESDADADNPNKGLEV